MALAGTIITFAVPATATTGTDLTRRDGPTSEGARSGSKRKPPNAAASTNASNSADIKPKRKRRNTRRDGKSKSKRRKK